jgi:DNA-directed RNA polymerase sigma subunit (sigma70/sigma32)
MTSYLGQLVRVPRLAPAGARSLEQVRERFGVTRQRVRPIDAKAPRLKLRARHLRSSLEGKAEP